jgi:hypothetical protein
VILGAKKSCHAPPSPQPRDVLANKEPDPFRIEPTHHKESRMPEDRSSDHKKSQEGKTLI